jgi:hypothetical protein
MPPIALLPTNKCSKLLAGLGQFELLADNGLELLLHLAKTLARVH